MVQEQALLLFAVHIPLAHQVRQIALAGGVQLLGTGSESSGLIHAEHQAGGALLFGVAALYRKLHAPLP